MPRKVVKKNAVRKPSTKKQSLGKKVGGGAKKAVSARNKRLAAALKW